MEASVHSPGAAADGAPDVLAFAVAFAVAFAGAFAGASELNGAVWVGVADVAASLEDADEQPLTNASPVPPTAKRSTALLAVV